MWCNSTRLLMLISERYILKSTNIHNDFKINFTHLYYEGTLCPIKVISFLFHIPTGCPSSIFRLGVANRFWWRATRRSLKLAVGMVLIYPPPPTNANSYIKNRFVACIIILRLFHNYFSHTAYDLTKRAFLLSG